MDRRTVGTSVVQHSGRRGFGMLDQRVHIGEDAQGTAVAVEDVARTSRPLDPITQLSTEACGSSTWTISSLPRWLLMVSAKSASTRILALSLVKMAFRTTLALVTGLNGDLAGC